MSEIINGFEASASTALGSEAVYDYDGVILDSGDALNVYSYGKAKDITVNSGGKLIMDRVDLYEEDQTFADFWNHYALDTVINAGGTMNVRGGYTQSTKINAGGIQNVYGPIIRHEGNGDEPSTYVLPDELISTYDTMIDGGTQTTIAANTLRTTINNGGLLVMHGGTADSLTINAGGTAKIYTYDEISYSGDSGFHHLNFSGRTVDMTINGGSAYLYNDTFATGTQIGTGGVLTVNTGAEAFSTTISAGGSLIVLGSGKASDTILNGGSVHVATGGLVDNVTINSGNLYLYGGAVLDGTVNVNGTVVLDDVAMNRGTLNLQLSATSAASPMVNDLSLLEGGSLSITVDAVQASSSYLLAGNASDYDRSITVNAGGATLGTLSVNGSSLTYGDFKYRLTLSEDSALTLLVGSSAELTRPEFSVSTTEPTEGKVEITATFSPTSAIREYSLDGEHWSAYGENVVVSSNGTVYFREGDGIGNFGPIASCTVDNIISVLPDAPSTVSLDKSSYKKYTISLKWGKAETADRSVKISGYEVSVNGEVYRSKSTSFTLKNVDLGSYDCMVRAIDSAGNVGEWSEVKVFTAIDETAPTVKIQSASVDGYDLALAWNGSDQKGNIVSYTVKLDGAVRETLAGDTRSITLALTEGDIGKHKVEILAFDGINYSKAAAKSVTVKDATPPEQVTGLSVPVADSKYKATLSWSAGVDNSGKIARYEILLDDGKILKTNKNSLSIGKLTVGEHTYQVRVIDKDKNVGEWSEAQSFTVSDVTAPTTVSAKAKVTENTVALSWKAAKDNVGVVGYELWTGATPSEMTLEALLSAEQLNYDLTEIPKGTLYYGICAVDAAGNVGSLKALKTTIKTELATPDLAAFAATDLLKWESSPSVPVGLALGL